jgi:hypothetical protein
MLPYPPYPQIHGRTPVPSDMTIVIRLDEDTVETIETLMDRLDWQIDQFGPEMFYWREATHVSSYLAV